MSAEQLPPTGPQPGDKVTTCVYDANGNGTRQTDSNRQTMAYSYDLRERTIATEPAVPRPVRRRGRAAVPFDVVVFEFRLCGSEAKEQTKALSDPGPWAVAARTVRAFLPRAAEAGAVPTAIAGLEAHTSVADGALFCRVALSDFAAADLVVVQVEVAVYRVRD